MKMIITIFSLLVISYSAVADLTANTQFSLDTFSSNDPASKVVIEAIKEVQSNNAVTHLIAESRQDIEDKNITPAVNTKDMNDIDLVFLRVYTRSGFKILNSTLREMRPHFDRNKNSIDISNLTDDEKTKLEKIDAWTNATTSALSRIQGHPCRATRVTTVPDDVFLEIERTKMYKDFGFVSSAEGTLDKVGSKYKTFLGSHKFIINSNNCKNISWISRWPQENEVLFPPGTSFRVINIEKETWPITIFLEHVN